MCNVELIHKTVENLKRNNMDSVFIESKEQLRQLLDEYIQEGDEVTFGGSVTLGQTGAMDYLHELDEQGKITLLDRNKDGISQEDVAEIFREAFRSDVYLASSNAVTADGYLYNVDGNGNRVAAMIFGPKNVVVIVGCNKIVETKEEAIQRIQKVSAPLNAQRLHADTPCAKTGECMHCMSDGRICCSYTFFGKQRIKGRIKVVIIGEEYGF